MSAPPPQGAGVLLLPCAPDDADWMRRVHLDHYARAHGFDGSFADAVDAALAQMQAAGRGWIAWERGARVGCVALTDAGSGAARIQLFFVVASRRGTGGGCALRTGATEAARADGTTRMDVATFAEHAAAGRIYARAGFALVSERAVAAFGQRLREQHWQKPL